MADLKLDVLHTHKVKALGSLLSLLQFAHMHAHDGGEIKVGCVVTNLRVVKNDILRALNRDWDKMEAEIKRLRAENEALKAKL